MKTEKWECKECEGAPCKVEIHYSNKEVPEHLKYATRFKNKVCLCKEPQRPNWVKK